MREVLLAASLLCALVAQSANAQSIVFHTDPNSPFAQAGTMVQLIGKPGLNPRISIDGYGPVHPILTGQVAYGTPGARLNTPAGVNVFAINGRAYDGSTGGAHFRDGFAYSGAQIKFFTTEDQDLTHHGMEVNLSTTPKATGTTHGDQDIVRQTWRDDGRIVFHAYEPGNLTVESGGLLASSPNARPVGGFLGLGPVADYRLSSGAVAVTGSRARIDTEGGASSDELIGVAGCVTDGDIVVLQAYSSARPITAKDQAPGGNLQLAGDFVLGNSSYRLTLMCQTSNGVWVELSRSNNG